MEVVIKTQPSMLGKFAVLDRDRGSWQRDYGNWMLADPRIRGEVLEIGSSSGTTSPPFDRLYSTAAAVDGVDPDPAIKQLASLRRSWVNVLEEAHDIPDSAYDAAVGILVVEHVSKPRAFLEKVFRVLKPGGVFYATTPSSHHPFAWIVRTIENMGLKRFFKEHSGTKINEYPAYYRMNSPRAVIPMAREIGFASATFYHYPCVQWDTYFPRPLRVFPHLYDRALGIRIPALNQVLMYKLEKPGSDAVSG